MTEVDYVTANSPDVIVYVDAQGNVLYTSGAGQAAATPAASSVAAVAEVATPTAATAATTAPAYNVAPNTPATSAVSAAVAPSSSSSSSSSGSISGVRGLSYSPYAGTYQSNDVGCKTQDQVNADFQQIDSGTYNLVRIYGTDCNQVSNVLAAASAKSMKVMVGVYNITDLANELNIITESASKQWNNVHTVSIGNELVNAGTNSASDVVAAVNSARSTLRSSGFTGPVVAVDTFIAMENNPSLCQNSDYAAVNAHPFFDGSIDACDSGKWVVGQMQAVSAACGGKDTMITETGWPWGGQSYNSAVPSPQNQKVAMETIAGNVTSNVIMFTAFNDMWKNPGYLSVEQSWGFYGNSAAS